MNEAQFGAKFQQWWGVYKPCKIAALEYKVTNTNTFNLTNWRKKQPLQEIKLRDANSNKGVIWKISDLDPRTKPFDAFFISDAPAFLVIWYGKYDTFFMIPVKEIPKQTSISYKYCCLRFIPYKLLKIIKPHYEI